MKNLVLVLLAATVAIQQATAQCAKGDLPCFCRSFGGFWVNQPSGLLSACQLNYQWQGKQRYVRIFLPPNYDGARSYPLWVQLHGVFWSTMGGIGKQIGRPLNATDIAPTWDRIVERQGSQAIIVYPQSTGYAGTGNEAAEGQGDKYRQFWHIPFWTCSVGICTDTNVDDIGFLTNVISDLPNKLKADRSKYLLSGDSAGGMMVQALLCESPGVTKTITAAIDVLGGIGKDYALGPKCANKNAVAFLKIHGMTDPFITYDREILVDNVNFLSAVDGAKRRAAVNGCPAWAAGGEQSLIGGKVKCTNFCEKTPQNFAASVCGIVNVAHSTDYPYPGWAWQHAFDFMMAASRSNSARNAAKAKAASNKQQQQEKAKKQTATPGKKVTANSSNRKSSGGAGRTLLLQMTFQDVSLQKFQQHLGGKDVAIVAAITKLPVQNISAAYESINTSSMTGQAAAEEAAVTGSSRPRRLVAAAAAAEGSTRASYLLVAEQPSIAAGAIISAVQSGQLHAALQRQSPTAVLQARVQLSTQDLSSDSSEILLPPTQLQPSAAVAADGDTPAAPTASAAEAVAAAAAAAATTALPSAAADKQQVVVSSSSSSGGHTSKVNEVTLVGVVLGAAAGVVLLAGLAWWAAAARKRRRQQDLKAVGNAANQIDRSSSTGSSLGSSHDAVMHINEAQLPVGKSTVAVS